MSGPLLGAAGLLAAAASFGFADNPATQKWSPYGDDREGVASYDPASVVREGPRVRVRVRIVPAVRPGEEPHHYVADRAFDCRAQTATLLSAEEYGAGPEPVRSVTVPTGRIRYEPVYAGDSDAALYKRLCPHAKPLPRFQPGAPPIVATPPVTPSPGDAAGATDRPKPNP